jgi:hypothetical protein
MRLFGPCFAVFALAFAASAYSGAAHAAPSPPLKAIWGPAQLLDGTSAFPIYRDLGVDVLQLQLQWDQTAPKRPRRAVDPGDSAYRWPATVDAAVDEAARNGIQVALLVRGSPRWANGGRPSRWAPKPVHYARFLTAASRRYGVVRRWMIWGEANRAAVFAPLPPNRPRGPRTYARLLDAAYGALKRRSRRNVVIGGMTFSFGEVLPAKWLRWMRLPGGRRPRLDEYGHNPFSHRPPNLRRQPYESYPDARDVSDMDTFAAELRRAYRGQRPFRRGGPPLWLSEFTVSSNRPNRAFDFAVSRRDQARWLRGAYGIAKRVRASGFGWFNVQDEPPTVARGLTTGLLAHGGGRKPAYRAFKRLR